MKVLWNMIYATAEGDAGECAIRAVGVEAFTRIPSPSFLHSGQTAASCLYRIRSTTAGVILSSSLTAVLSYRCIADHGHLGITVFAALLLF